MRVAGRRENVLSILNTVVCDQWVFVGPGRKYEPDSYPRIRAGYVGKEREEKIGLCGELSAGSVLSDRES